MSIDRPSQFLKEIEKNSIANVWRIVEKQTGKGAHEMTLKDWIESCTFVMGRPLPGQPNITMNEEVARYFLVGNMCVAKWRLTKSIYRFNTTLLEELVHTDIRTIAEAPCSVFRCLPEPCVWVDMRGIRGIDGYFACVNGEELVRFVAKESRNSITFIPFNRTRIGAEILTNSDPQITAERDDCKFCEKPLPDDLIAVYASLLYLCSDSPDFGDRKPPIYTPPKRTKTGWKEKSTAHVWNVGIRTGTAIKLFKEKSSIEYTENQEGSGRTKRPHIRRAHWHGYWTGHRYEPEQRKFIYRWIPAIPINVTDAASMPIVIRPVTE